MLRLVANEGKRLPVKRGRARAPVRARPASADTAKLNLDCELSAIIATTMVEAMLRCGIARPEQAEFVMSQVADRYDALVSDAPMHLRDRPEWKDFERRCQRAAADIREAAFEIVMGCAR